MGLSQQRVVEIFAERPHESQHGSGYLVGPALVLTAGHVVSGAVAPVLVRFPHSERLWPGSVVWCEPGGSAGEIDAALIRLVEDELPEWVRWAEPVRFGRFVTSDGAVDAEAHGFPEIPGFHERSEVEHVVGRIPCGAGTTGRPHIAVASPPARAAAVTVWRGMSGAAVWSGGLLVGVVTTDVVAFAGGRMTFEPVERLLARGDFTGAMGGEPVFAAAVELVALAPHWFTDKPISPARMLRAQSGVIAFSGRDDELGALEEWCSGKEDSVMLLHAQGGQGKTRLALELVERQRRRGWVGAMVHADFHDMAAALGRVEVERALLRSQVELLIIVDYAEAWCTSSALSDDPVRRLLRLIKSRPTESTAPVRVLLIARSPGAWWTDLRDKLHGLATREMRLGPLADDRGPRPALYREALTALASGLTQLPGYAGGDWPAVAAGLAPPAALDEVRYAHALTLYERALADLLQAGPRPVPVGPSASTEDILLSHESTYWSRTAEAHRLDLTPPVLREAVAAVTLFGARSNQQADNLIRLLPAVRERDFGYRRRVTDWLAHLYPDPSGAWGVLEPDRLGEHLIASVWADESTLLAAVKPHLLAPRSPAGDEMRLGEAQIHRMLIVLDRITRTRDHWRGTLRTIQFLRDAGRLLPIWPERQRREYLRLGAHKARVPDAEVVRIGNEFAYDDAPLAWSSRWAWWNAQRAARVFAVPGELHVAVVQVGGGPCLLAVNSSYAACYELATGQLRKWLFGLDSRETRFTAACSGVFGARLHIAVGLNNRSVWVWRCDADGNGEWLGGYGQPLGEQHGLGVKAVALTEAAGALRVIGADWLGSTVVVDPYLDRRLAVFDAAARTGSNDIAVLHRQGRPLFVTADGDGRIRTYDLLRLEPTETHEYGYSEACAIAHVPWSDLRTGSGSASSAAVVITGHFDGRVCLYDLDTRTVLAEMVGHSQEVTAVCVDRVDNLPIAITTGADRTVITWDLRTGEQLGSAYTGHADPVAALTTGRLGTDLVAITAGKDFTTRVWDMTNVDLPEAALAGHTQEITAVAIVRGNSAHLAVTASQDKTVRVWDLDAGGCAGAEGMPDLYRTRRNTGAVAAAIHRDGLVVVAGDVDGSLVTLSPGGAPDQRPIWLEHAISAMDCRVFDDRVLAVGADNSGMVVGWDPLRGIPLGPKLTGDHGAIHRVRLAVWRRRPVAIVATHDRCRTVDLTEGRFDERAYGGEFRHEHVLGLGWLDREPCVIVANPVPDERSCIVHVLELTSREQVWPDCHFPAMLRRADIVDSGAGPALLAIGLDGQIWFRSPDSAPHAAAPVGAAPMSGLSTSIVAATVYRDSAALLLGGVKGELELIDAKTGAPLIDTESPNPVATTMATHRGVPVVLVASESGKLVCRDLHTGARVGPAIPLRIKVSALHTIAEADGTELVVGRDLLGIQVWASDTMTPLPAWNTSEERPSMVVLRPGGEAIVVAARSDRLGTEYLAHRRPFGPVITALHAERPPPRNGFGRSALPGTSGGLHRRNARGHRARVGSHHGQAHRPGPGGTRRHPSDRRHRRGRPGALCHQRQRADRGVVGGGAAAASSAAVGTGCSAALARGRRGRLDHRRLHASGAGAGDGVRQRIAFAAFRSGGPEVRLPRRPDPRPHHGGSWRDRGHDRAGCRGIGSVCSAIVPMAG